MIIDLFNLPPCDLLTEFEDKENIDIDKVVTTVSQGLIRTKNKDFVAGYLTEKYWNPFKFSAYNIYHTSNLSMVGNKIIS